jgi:hypothetical protein
MNNKENKFLKYLKIILESQKDDGDYDEEAARRNANEINYDDEELEVWERTGKLPEGADMFELLDKYSFRYGPDEIEDIIKINKVLSKAGSPVIRFVNMKNNPEKDQFTTSEEKERFIDALTNIVINSNGNQRLGFLSSMYAHSYDFHTFVKNINDFVKYNEDDYPSFCEKLKRLFHATETFNFKINDLFEKTFLKDLNYLKDEPIVKSNETINDLVHSFLKNLNNKKDISSIMKTFDYKVELDEVLECIGDTVTRLNKELTDEKEKKDQLRKETKEDILKKYYPYVFKKWIERFPKLDIVIPEDNWYHFGKLFDDDKKFEEYQEKVKKEFKKPEYKFSDKYLNTPYLDKEMIEEVFEKKLEAGKYEISQIKRVFKHLNKIEKQVVLDYIEQEELFDPNELN